MIDFSSCDKAIEYMDRGEYDKLRRFINREREKYYLGIATGALRKYMKQNPDLQGRFVYGYLDEGSRDLGKLLIAFETSLHLIKNICNSSLSNINLNFDILWQKSLITRVLISITFFSKLPIVNLGGKFGIYIPGHLSTNFSLKE